MHIAMLVLRTIAALFTVLLCVVDAVEKGNENEERDMTTAPNVLSVFLVEDDPNLLFVLEESIKCLGHSVGKKAERLVEALECSRSGSFDVAMLDVNLHGEDSFLVADELRMRGIPFAFTTGYGPTSLPERFHDAAVMEKPFRLSDIQETLDVLYAASSQGLSLGRLSAATEDYHLDTR